jgi:hypothetical protein
MQQHNVRTDSPHRIIVHRSPLMQSMRLKRANRVVRQGRQKGDVMFDIRERLRHGPGASRSAADDPAHIAHLQ